MHGLFVFLRIDCNCSYERSVIFMKSMYSLVFDSKCPLWDKNQKFNLTLLQSKQTYFNDLLKIRGYVFLRDVYEDLGFPVTVKTLFVGWVYDLENSIGDNFIDFGITTKGEEPNIELDFNVDGIITNWFKEES